MFAPSEIAALKTLYPTVSLGEEGGCSYLLIEKIKLPRGAEPNLVDGLLCPTPRDGYPSRLFISSKIVHAGKGQNWNPQHSTVLLGRSWWCVSWKVREKQTLIQLVLDHLGAFSNEPLS